MDNAAGYEYEICLSFAGEQRTYVEQVAKGLQRAGVKMFYDEFDQASLWGKNLYEHLDWVYRRSARFCVLFASIDYARKNWTNHERRSAQARALEGRSEYLLPVRFDDSEIPGLLPTISYIDGLNTTPDQLTTLILVKLGRTDNAAVATPHTKPWSTPNNDVERARLLTARPPAWEFLFLGGELLRAMGSFEPLWRDHEIRYVDPTTPRIEDEVAHLSDSFDYLERTVGNINNILNPQAQVAAFGPPGQSGDPGRITYMAERLVGIYGDLLKVASSLRSARVQPDFARAYWIASYACDRPIWELRQFFFQMVREFNEASVTIHTQPGATIRLEPHLKLTLDDRVMNDFNAELKKVRRRARGRS